MYSQRLSFQCLFIKCVCVGGGGGEGAGTVGFFPESAVVLQFFLHFTRLKMLTTC